VLGSESAECRKSAAETCLKLRCEPRSTQFNRSNVESQFDDDSHTLCIIPSKYRKKLWIKIGAFLRDFARRCDDDLRAGQFVIIDSAPASDDYKVQGQIAVVLNERQIDYCKSENVW
jgi:hypothetical protein